MKIRSLLALTLAAVATVGPCAAAAAGESLSTSYTLLVGHPDPLGDAVGTVLLVPGTLIPSMEGPGELAEKLREAYRLEKGSLPKSLAPQPSLLLRCPFPSYPEPAVSSLHQQ